MSTGCRCACLQQLGSLQKSSCIDLPILSPTNSKQIGQSSAAKVAGKLPVSDKLQKHAALLQLKVLFQQWLSKEKKGKYSADSSLLTSIFYFFIKSRSNAGDHQFVRYGAPTSSNHRQKAT